MAKRLLISQAAQEIGVTPKTLREWERSYPDFPKPDRDRFEARFYTEETIARIKHWRSGK